MQGLAAGAQTAGRAGVGPGDEAVEGDRDVSDDASHASADPTRRPNSSLTFEVLVSSRAASRGDARCRSSHANCFPTARPATSSARRSAQPYVTIQVLPFRAGQHVEAGGSLLLYTLPNEPLLAYEEGSRFGTFIEDRDRVAERRKNYDLLRAMALSPLDSEAMIRAVMKDWTSWEAPQI
nr:Scr1 family TA system antitoxin-like transcriptional regulator [Streptomyces sabulosicollis]